MQREHQAESTARHSGMQLAYLSHTYGRDTDADSGTVDKLQVVDSSASSETAISMHIFKQSSSAARIIP